MRVLFFIDIFFHVSYVPVLLVDLLPESLMKDTFGLNLDVVCTWSYNFFSSLRMASCLTEMHISFFVLAQAAHWKGIMNRLAVTLPVTVLTGLVAGAWSAAASPWGYDPHEDICLAANPKLQGQVICVVLFVCVVAYAVSMYKSCTSAPASVRGRALQRAAIYPLNFTVSYGGAIAAYCSEWVRTNRWSLLAVLFMEANSGAMNVLAYASQGGLLRRWAGRYGNERRLLNAAVGFGGLESNDSGMGLPPRRASPAPDIPELAVADSDDEDLLDLLGCDLCERERSIEVSSLPAV